MRLSSFFRSSFFWFFGAAAFLFLVYLPDFVSVFGMHNDLSLLYKLPPWPHFSETDHLLIMGRPVGAFLVNISYHTLHRLEELGIWRFISFLTMLSFLGVMWFYLERKWGLKRSWACATVVSIGLLPAWVLSVTWVCQWAPGSLVSLLAGLTYMLWDHARAGGRARWLSAGMIFLAFLLFEILMYTYPVGALLVFAFTFGYVLWFSGGLNQLRRIVFWDVVFFGFGVLVYRLTERLWITPLFAARTAHITLPPEYQMAITRNILSKTGLFGELLGVSLAGTWHLFLGEKGVWVWLAVVLTCLGLTRICFCKWNVLYVLRHQFTDYGERFFYLCGLFLLVSLPLILAGGMTKLPGYRVAMTGSIVGIFVFWWALRRAFLVAPRNRRVFFGLFSSAITGIWGALVCVHLMDVVKNYQEEAKFVETAVRSWDPATVQYCIFVELPFGETFLNRRMLYEFSLMITDPQHFLPLVLRGRKDQPATRHGVTCHVMLQEEAARVVAHPGIVFIDPRRARSFYGY